MRGLWESWGFSAPLKNVFRKTIKQGEIRLIGHPLKNKMDKSLLNGMERKCHYL